MLNFLVLVELSILKSESPKINKITIIKINLC